jgi:hypothetical protein
MIVSFKMKNIILLLLLSLLSRTTMSQTYVSIATSLANTPGTIGQKSNIAVEAGKQWDVFSLGLDLGLSALTKADTCTYLEIRPNLNVFQVGKFTNTLTPGIGYIFNAKENLLTELTYGIEYTASPQIHLNIVFGQYYYSGVSSASTETFFGISLMYYFKPNKSISLIK